MKKLMVAASAALCATVSFAELASANIVGYNTVTINQEWTILAVNFAKVDGNNLTIQEALPYSEGMTKGKTTTGDQVQVQNTSGGYDIYYLSDGNFTAKGQTKYYPERDGKWFKGNATSPATDQLAPGQAFWYGAKGYQTPFSLTVAGSILTSLSKSIVVNQAWTHVANPYPVPLALNDGFAFVEGMTKGKTTTGDQIQIPNATGGYDIYYLSDGNFTAKGQTKYYPERDGKWFKGNATTPTTDSIPVGTGAWYGRKGDSDFTVTISTPISL